MMYDFIVKVEFIDENFNNNDLSNQDNCVLELTGMHMRDDVYFEEFNDKVSKELGAVYDDEGIVFSDLFEYPKELLDESNKDYPLICKRFLEKISEAIKQTYGNSKILVILDWVSDEYYEKLCKGIVLDTNEYDSKLIFEFQSDTYHTIWLDARTQDSFSANELKNYILDEFQCGPDNKNRSVLEELIEQTIIDEMITHNIDVEGRETIISDEINNPNLTRDCVKDICEWYTLWDEY